MAKAKSSVAPGSNWAALQTKIAPAPSAKSSFSSNSASSKIGNRSRGGPSIMSGEMTSKQKKRKMMNDFAASGDKNGESSSSGIVQATIGVDVPATTRESVNLLPVPEDCTDRRLVEELRVMVAGKAVLSEAKKAPGTYIALDCEMVGLGPGGSESCLARISVVNYHGHVLLDTFVQPRETVTDWRTWISGIRASDVVNAPQFEAVQKQVSALCEDRIVVGHAIENDMKALLLSHPGPMTRDTQTCKPLREKARTKRPGLKKLVEMELGIRIQTGAHSSVTDARATMGLYRLHKTVWEQQVRQITESYREKMGLPAMNNGPIGKGKEKASTGGDDQAAEKGGKASKRKRNNEEEGEGENGTGRFEDEGGLLHAQESEDRWKKRKLKKKGGDNDGGGVKGISSGVTEVIRHKDGTREVRGRKAAAISASGGGNWWEDDANA